MKLSSHSIMFPSPWSFLIAGLVLQATAAPAAASKILTHSKVLTPQDFKQTIADGVWCVFMEGTFLLVYQWE
jgi:hypothetical protein